VVRLADFMIASTALLILAPLLLPVCIILRLTGEGEVFFLQGRVGIGKENFKLIKFATMLKNSPNIGSGTLTLANDPRVLPFGRILRSTKINELPQLLNVLFGHMSLVGPRPQAEKNFLMYSPKSQNMISSIKPGLTGIGSLIFSNEEEILQSVSNPEDFYRNQIMPYKAALEEWYITKKNFKLYCQILIATFLRLALKKNLSALPFDTLPKPSYELGHILTTR
jgi:lipopolysaccharide/colanic/teichoic acid biosynthesis glycosyltransferase